MTMLARQLEGRLAVKALGGQTNHWGFVTTPYGKMWLAGNDDGVALRFHHGYVYEPVSLAAWQACCECGGVAIDVGAHTGVYTLAAYAAGARRVSIGLLRQRGSVAGEFAGEHQARA
jgi:hypothetical protein